MKINNQKTKKRSSKKSSLRRKNKLSQIMFRYSFKFLEKLLIILKIIEIIRKLFY